MQVDAKAPQTLHRIRGVRNPMLSIGLQRIRTERWNYRWLDLRSLQRALLELLHLTVAQNARRRSRHQQKVASSPRHQRAQPVVDPPCFRGLLAPQLFRPAIEGVVTEGPVIERIVDFSSTHAHQDSPSLRLVAAHIPFPWESPSQTSRH